MATAGACSDAFAFMEIVGEERQRKAMAAIFAAMLPGGRFICTMHNPVVRRKLVDGALRVVGRFPVPQGSLVVSGFEQVGIPVAQRPQAATTVCRSIRLPVRR
jgi:hypothetical protein